MKFVTRVFAIRIAVALASITSYYEFNGFKNY